MLSKGFCNSIIFITLANQIFNKTLYGITDDLYANRNGAAWINLYAHKKVLGFKTTPR